MLNPLSRWQEERDSALGVPSRESKTPSPLRSAGALHKTLSYGSFFLKRLRPHLLKSVAADKRQRQRATGTLQRVDSIFIDSSPPLTKSPNPKGTGNQRGDDDQRLQ